MLTIQEFSADLYSSVLAFEADGKLNSVTNNNLPSIKLKWVEYNKQILTQFEKSHNQVLKCIFI